MFSGVSCCHKYQGLHGAYFEWNYLYCILQLLFWIIWDNSVDMEKKSIYIKHFFFTTLDEKCCLQLSAGSEQCFMCTFPHIIEVHYKQSLFPNTQ